MTLDIFSSPSAVLRVPQTVRRASRSSSLLTGHRNLCLLNTTSTSANPTTPGCKLTHPHDPSAIWTAAQAGVISNHGDGTGSTPLWLLCWPVLLVHSPRSFFVGKPRESKPNKRNTSIPSTSLKESRAVHHYLSADRPLPGADRPLGLPQAPCSEPSMLAAVLTSKHSASVGFFSRLTPPLVIGILHVRRFELGLISTQRAHLTCSPRSIFPRVTSFLPRCLP